MWGNPNGIQTIKNKINCIINSIIILKEGMEENNLGNFTKLYLNWILQS